jgi:DNA-binding HxlR family transcriptional regulator
MHCSIARTFAALDDAWSALILRDVFVGLRRFDVLIEDLGISRKVLTQRLLHLQDSGLLSATAYQLHPKRVEYALTAAGLDLVPALLALLAWGDRWKAPQGPPALLSHHGHPVKAKVVCSRCGEALDARHLHASAGPGGRRAAGTRRMYLALAPRARRSAR